MKVVQPHLKDSALGTETAAKKLIALLQEATHNTQGDLADWLIAAKENVSRYESMLNTGIQEADPDRVLHGVRVLTQMSRYLSDVDLSSTGLKTQIVAALDSIHNAATPVINSIDRFDPSNLAEARTALQQDEAPDT